MSNFNARIILNEFHSRTTPGIFDHQSHVLLLCYLTIPMYDTNVTYADFLNRGEVIWIKHSDWRVPVFTCRQSMLVHRLYINVSMCEVICIKHSDWRVHVCTCTCRQSMMIYMYQRLSRVCPSFTTNNLGLRSFTLIYPFPLLSTCYQYLCNKLEKK